MLLLLSQSIKIIVRPTCTLAMRLSRGGGMEGRPRAEVERPALSVMVTALAAGVSPLTRATHHNAVRYRIRNPVNAQGPILVP
jgi:hypothetical protein